MTYSILFKEADSVTLAPTSNRWTKMQDFIEYGYTNIHYKDGNIILEKPVVVQVVEKSPNGEERRVDPTSFLQNHLQKVSITRNDCECLLKKLKDGKIKFEDIVKFN